MNRVSIDFLLAFAIALLIASVFIGMGRRRGGSAGAANRYRSRGRRNRGDRDGAWRVFRVPLLVLGVTTAIRYW